MLKIFQKFPQKKDILMMLDFEMLAVMLKATKAKRTFLVKPIGWPGKENSFS